MSTQGSFSNLTLILLVVGLVIGAGGGYFLASNSFQPKIQNYENQVNGLSTQVTELTSSVSNLETENSNYETQVSTLEDQVSTLETQVTNLQSELDEAEETIGEQEASISSSEDRISDLEAQIEILQTWTASEGYNRYSIYDFSFEYPHGWSVSLEGLLESIATESSGMITISSTSGEKAFSLGWMYTITPPNLDSGLEGGFEVIKDLNPVLGPRITSTINGHELKYQTATYTYEGVSYYLISSNWYCDLNDKYFFITYVSTEEDILSSQFHDAFICH